VPKRARPDGAGVKVKEERSHCFPWTLGEYVGVIRIKQSNALKFGIAMKLGRAGNRSRLNRAKSPHLDEISVNQACRLKGALLSNGYRFGGGGGVPAPIGDDEIGPESLSNRGTARA